MFAKSEIICGSETKDTKQRREEKTRQDKTRDEMRRERQGKRCERDSLAQRRGGQEEGCTDRAKEKGQEEQERVCTEGQSGVLPVPDCAALPVAHLSYP